MDSELQGQIESAIKRAVCNGAFSSWQVVDYVKALYPQVYERDIRIIIWNMVAKERLTLTDDRRLEPRDA